MTPKIHRYGRRLPVRTLVQIPYVHLYEWELLMDAYEMGLQQLPWVNQQDPVAVVEEIRAEIADGFQLIDQHANLTPLGKLRLNIRRISIGRARDAGANSGGRQMTSPGFEIRFVLNLDVAFRAAGAVSRRESGLTKKLPCGPIETIRQSNHNDGLRNSLHSRERPTWAGDHYQALTRTSTSAIT